ncbi:MAG: class I SAM-dependent methyltransferase [Deltaproteobacteria bacterium]|nr:class I SAM-dependent methyltransferase [Deltaproteobacteria bacterium]
MVGSPNALLAPAPLLVELLDRILNPPPGGPILDLACGDGHNGVFLAKRGLPVILADHSADVLWRARDLAESQGVDVRLWQVDLEKEGAEPLEAGYFGGILVFRYLHRPLIPCIKKGLRPGGVLLYETFTVDQARFGRPRNPDFLLKPGELMAWFEEWEVLYHFEGILKDPDRAMARILCRKPLH